LKKTDLELVFLKDFHVSVEFFLDLHLDDILMSEHFSDLVFAQWLSLFVSILQSLGVVSIVVLHFVVSLFGKLGKLSLSFVVDHIINNLRLNRSLVGFALDHVPHGSHLVKVHGGNKWHQLLEFFLVCLVLLVLSLDSQVKFSYLTDELLTISINSL
jgi:hypothetical protein